MTKSIGEFTPSPALAELISDVQLMIKQHTKYDWGAAISNVPLLLVTYGLVRLDTDDTSALKTVSMPDEWLSKAARLTSASPSALKRLHSDLINNGFVSIESADRFCCVEVAREQIAKLKQEKFEQTDKSEGAILLSQRVNSFGIETSLDEAISVGRDHLRHFANAGLGIASFTIEKTILVGKVLGVVAGIIQNSRNS